MKTLINVFCFLILVSLKSDEYYTIGLPGDLDKETIVLNKANYIKEWWASRYDGDFLCLPKYQNFIEDEWNRHFEAIKAYPFKYMIVDAKMSFGPKPKWGEVRTYTIEEINKPEGADSCKYIFEYLPMWTDAIKQSQMPQYVLTIRDNKNAKYYSLHKRDKQLWKNEEKQLGEMVAEVKKQYGK